jgi:hypothetical protein
MNRPTELFLSHASSDLHLATEVARTLRRHGVPVWFSRTDIRGSQQWHDEIGEALNRCDWFGVILTPSAVESRWMKREMVHALNDNRYDGRIVPLRFAPCAVERLSWVLPQLQAIDFQADMEDGYRELLQLWDLGYRPA